MSFSKGLALLYRLEGGLEKDPDNFMRDSYRGVTREFFVAWYAKREPAKIAPWPPSDELIANFYMDQYWSRFHCGGLPEPVDSVFFQFVVNAEVAAVQALQIGCHVRPDGDYGPLTLKAVEAWGSKDLTDVLLDCQRMHYCDVRSISDPLWQGLQDRVTTVEQALSEGVI
jgi:lysozyme family protein